MILKIILYFSDDLKLLYLNFVLIPPSAYTPRSSSESSALKTARPHPKPRKVSGSRVLHDSVFGPYAHTRTTGNILVPPGFACWFPAPSVLPPGPLADAAAKSAVKYGQLRALNVLVFSAPCSL